MTLTKINDRGLKYPIELLNNEKIRLGEGNNRLEALHNGSHSRVAHSGVGKLIITASTVELNNGANTETMLKAVQDGAVELYHNGNKKFETTATGIKVTGTTTTGSEFLGDFRVKGTDDSNFVTFKPSENLARWHDNDKAVFGSSNDLQIYHDGTSSYLDNDTGDLRINTASGEVQINKATSEYMARFIVDGAVELYYDNSKKLQTYSAGTEVIGNLWLQTGGIYVKDNVKLNIGNGTDLEIFHNGSHSYIQNTTNDLFIENTGDDIVIRTADAIFFQVNNNENAMTCLANAGVLLYHDNVQRFETTSSGTKTTGYHQQTAIPSFLAEHKNSDTHKKTGDLKNQFVRSFGTVRHNTGSHFSNSTGKFTAPVAGLYMFTMSMTFDKGDGVDDSAGCYFRVENNSGNYNRVHNNGRDFWNINARFFTTDGTELSQSFQSIELLDANATVGFYFTDFDDTTTELTVAFFSGHLIG
jgi:hypothetical protein